MEREGSIGYFIALRKMRRKRKARAVGPVRVLGRADG